MDWSKNRKWFTIALMGVIVPVSLLVTFKLTGIIREPQLPETIFGEVVTLNLTRPSSYASYGHYLVPIENHYTDDDITIRMSMHAASYEEMAIMGFVFEGSGVSFVTKANVSTFRGFPVSMNIGYYTDANSALFIDTQWSEGQNITVAEVKNPYTKLGAVSYISAEIGSPSYIRVQAFWAFTELRNVDRKLDVILEVMTFNGTTYKNIILPMLIYMCVDPGNSFKKALPITTGTYTGWLGIGIPSPGFNDIEDYYKLWVEKNQKINVTMTHQMSKDFMADLDLYLYGPNENLATDSCSKPPKATESTIWTANASGWYYIRVNHQVGSGVLYTLEISLHETHVNSTISAFGGDWATQDLS